MVQVDDPVYMYEDEDDDDGEDNGPLNIFCVMTIMVGADSYFLWRDIKLLLELIDEILVEIIVRMGQQGVLFLQL